MFLRTSEQWLALIDHHKTSGLTQTELAKQHRIDTGVISASASANYSPGCPLLVKSAALTESH